MKCYKNQLHQTHSVNVPNCVSDSKSFMEPDGSSHYVFACMAEAGYHQIIIYDPLLNKAFCKEFIVEHTDQWMLFPELPKMIEVVKPEKPLPPVFHKWIHDNIERTEKAYEIDTSPFSEDGGITFKDSFVPERFIKDTAEIAKCEDILRENFDCI